MDAQLALLQTGGADWRLDERTREVGRRGLSRARAALQDAQRRAQREAADEASVTDDHHDRRAA